MPSIAIYDQNLMRTRERMKISDAVYKVLEQQGYIYVARPVEIKPVVISKHSVIDTPLIRDEYQAVYAKDSKGEQFICGIRLVNNQVKEPTHD